MIIVTAFLGDAKRSFALTDPMILELERLTGTGIGVIYRRAVAMQFSLADVTETLRLAMIGAGTAPIEAARVASTWVANRPLAETYPLALDVLDARWNGTTPQKDDTE